MKNITKSILMLGILTLLIFLGVFVSHMFSFIIYGICGYFIGKSCGLQERLRELEGK